MFVQRSVDQCCLFSCREESRSGKFHLPLEKYKQQDVTRSATLRNVAMMNGHDVMNGAVLGHFLLGGGGGGVDHRRASAECFGFSF